MPSPFKIIGPNSHSLRNDYKLTHSLHTSALRYRHLLESKITPPIPRICDVRAFFPSSSPWLEETSSKLPKRHRGPGAVFELRRIPPVPRKEREVLVEMFFPEQLRRKVMEDEENEDCLIRIYLGERAAASDLEECDVEDGTSRKKKRVRGKVEKGCLRNFPLYLDQVEGFLSAAGLEGMTMQSLARSMALGLALCHWGAGNDAMDAEFVLGGSLGSDGPASDTETGNDPALGGIGEEDSTTEKRFGSPSLKGLEMWLLDFDKASSFQTYLGQESEGQTVRTPEHIREKLIPAVVGNDPYYPRPGRKGDEALWAVFKRAYLRGSRAILEERCKKGIKSSALREEVDGVMELPGIFIKEWETLAEEDDGKGEMGEDIVLGSSSGFAGIAILNPERVIVIEKSLRKRAKHLEISRASALNTSRCIVANIKHPLPACSCLMRNVTQDTNDCNCFHDSPCRTSARLRSAQKKATMDLSLGLEGTHVLVTGGAGHIGSVVISAFIAAGARVSSFDVAHPPNAPVQPGLVNPFEFHADITSEESLDTAWDRAVEKNGVIQCCVALAALDLSVLDHHESITTMSVEQFRRTLDVNVTGTFLVAREWLRGLQGVKHASARQTPKLRNLSLIIVGSESGTFGERTNPDYATSKSAVQGGLLKSLMADAPRVWPGARVNAIAPGPVDTLRFQKECQENPAQLYMDAQATVALGEPVAMDVVARSIVYLASERWSGNVHGQVLSVDSGKQGKVMWSTDECS
ncbi:NAD(P)-binding protein [Aulographum hederae CBS 113979]|uniref:NAD(P)-binding protein n=1 Tax=Aulographum hederae CBS 113979 TaxID=1176131 RepID=A0A6G1H0F0_9PEZI|nr:NAD(P)-binding protein [Aulographum hederae CBS 113979]